MASPTPDDELLTLARKLIDLREAVGQAFLALREVAEDPAATADRLEATYGTSLVGLRADALVAVLRAYHQAVATTSDPLFLAPHLEAADPQRRRATYGPARRELG